MPFLITKSPAMKKVAAGFGFAVNTGGRMGYWAHVTGVENRLPESAKLKKPRYIKVGERVLMTRFDCPGYGG